MKLTEESLNLVIDILNDLICEGKMLNDVERRSLLNAVMAITAVKRTFCRICIIPKRAK